MDRRLYGDFSHRSSTPLSAVNNSHGDWYYDENTMLFSYISMFIHLLFFLSKI